MSSKKGKEGISSPYFRSGDKSFKKTKGDQENSLSKSVSIKRALEKDYNSAKSPDSKMVKMDQNDIKQVLTEMGPSLFEFFQPKLDEISSSCKEIKDDVRTLKENLETEKAKRVELESSMDALNLRVDELEKKIDGKKVLEMPEIVEQVLPKVRENLSEQLDGAYFSELAQEMRKHEKVVVIFGFKGGEGEQLVTELKGLFKNSLGVEIESIIAQKMGVAKEGKEPPIRVEFQTFIDRNNVLKNSKKIPTGIKVVKSLPQKYRDKSAEFLTLGWQLRVTKNVITRVIPNGHLLMLQMKKPDEGNLKFDWTIVKEWYPKRGEGGSHAHRGGEGSVGIPTQPLTQEDKNKVIIADMPEMSEVDMKNKFELFLEKGDKKNISDTYFTEKYIILSFKQKDKSQDFLRKYRGKFFDGKKVKISGIHI